MTTMNITNETNEAEPDVDSDDDDVGASYYLFAAIRSIFASETKITIHPLTDTGHVIFTTTFADLGIINTQLWSHPFFYTRSFANLFGELLVRQNIEDFSKLLLQPDYHKMVKLYRHSGFGMRLDETEISFEFHISLLYSIINETLHVPDESPTEPITVPPQTVERHTDTILSSNGQGEISIKVNKNIHPIFAMGEMVRALLYYFGIRDRHMTFRTDAFSYELLLTDKKRA